MTESHSFLGSLLGPLLGLRLLSLRSPPGRAQRYALVAVLGTVLIALTAFIVLLLTPKIYTSRWTLILPGAGGTANLVL